MQGQGTALLSADNGTVYGANEDWFHSLYSRLALVFVGLLFLTACSYAGMAYVLVQRSTAANHQAIHLPLARTFARQLAPNLAHPLDLKAVKALFHTLMLANPNIELYYLDQASTVLAHTLQTPLQRQRVDMAPIARLLAADDPYPIYADDPSSADQQALFSVAQVPHGGSSNTYVYVVLQSENQDMLEGRQLSTHLWSLGFMALFGSLALSLVAGLWLFRRLTLRLRQLGQIMESASDSGFCASHRYALQTGDDSNDEIAQLGARFDGMASRIQRQMSDLQAQDKTRRQLMANISHDLRTPLASLRGYVETLQLKGESLAPDLRQNFLETAMRHCMRLQRLIDDMFEVAKLDSTTTELVQEAFSLDDLLHDTVMDHQVVAGAAGVQLKFAGEQAVCHVMGNLAGIQRVLDNLFSNAIRFTPTGGHVKVGIEVRRRIACITVHNTGSYIRESERSAIFERFYQSGNRHRSGEHAGLGLAIATKVLELHKQRLVVESTREFGTAFSFDLQLISLS